MIRKLLSLCTVLITSISFAQNPYITTAPFISGLAAPLTMAHCGDSRVFISQKSGIIRIADAITGTLVTTPFLNIDPRVGSSGSEQGLLGLAFHPQYKQNGYFFVDYTNNNGNTVISRFSIDPLDSNLALPNSEVILYTITQPYSNHNGGNILFGPDGYLYIGMGDGGSAGDPQNRAQNRGELLGKILRIDVSHGDSAMLPPTNPYINTTGARGEIWQTGIRNPWRYSFDNLTGDLWIGDVGQNLWEEIDFQPANSSGGENWGWRCYEGNVAYNTAGCQPQNTYDAPIYVYAHTGGNCSVSGGYIYRGARYGNLNGYYLFSDYCVPSIRTLNDSVGTYNYLQHSTLTGGGIVGFGQDMYGEMYVFNLNANTILRIVDSTSCAPNVKISDKDTVQFCDTVGILKTAYYPGFVYQWYQNGVVVGGNEPMLSVNQSDIYSVTVLNPVNLCSQSDTVFIKMGNLVPQIVWSNPDTFICANNGALILSATPTGGLFYGKGISDSTFTPTGLGYGSYLFEYVYTDTLGCITHDVRKIKLSNCTGIQENATNLFSIFPNPSKGEVTVSLMQAVSFELKLEVTDVAGRIVYQSNLVSGQQKIQFSLEGFDTGSYLVRLSGGNFSKVKPLMIVR